jgi:hypothetical protein
VQKGTPIPIAGSLPLFSDDNKASGSMSDNLAAAAFIFAVSLAKTGRCLPILEHWRLHNKVLEQSWRSGMLEHIGTFAKFQNQM